MIITASSSIHAHEVILIDGRSESSDHKTLTSSSEIMKKPCFCPAGLRLVVALTLVAGWSGSVQGVGDDVWEEVSRLRFLGGEEFKRLVNPLVEMTANAYRYPGVIAIPGWTLVDAVAPVHGGMHAIVYQDDCNSARMVLAFRGTDISGSESSRADLCAGEILWGGGPLPAERCSDFSSDTLDYYTQSVEYTRRMLEAHPQASFLLTGHSLGAGLAILVTSTLGSTPNLLPIVAFSSTGTKTVLQRMSLKLTSAHRKRLYIVADQWDEIMRLSWEDQVGILCLYQTPITVDCRACFTHGTTTISPSPGSSAFFSTCTDYSPHNLCQRQDSDAPLLKEGKLLEVELNRNGLNGSSVECLSCFYQTHYLQHVIDLVELGEKPVCEVRGD